MTDVMIAGAPRTPIAGFDGSLAERGAPAPGGVAIRAALDGAGGSPVDEVPMGCVLSAGQGRTPARQVGFEAGLSGEVPVIAVDEISGSGMKAAMLALGRLALGHAEAIVTGGGRDTAIVSERT